MQYSTVVFDIDGTLIDTEDAIIHALQWALRKCTGKEYAPSELTFCLGIPGENALRQLGVPDIQTTLAVWDARFKESAGETGLFDGIRPLVETLHSRGIPLGIITSKTREEYQFDFLRRGIGEYFGCSICTEDSKTHKPHPGPMLEYLRRTGFPPEKAIYIGDSTYDMQCARSAGVDCALALWGCRRPDGILSDYRLLRPADLLKLVDDTVTVTVDRPHGSRPPERPELL